MAKYERELNGDFSDWLRWMDDEVPSMSASSNLEESIDRHDGDTKLAIRAYERYSMAGSSRLGLTVVLMETKGKLWLSAVSTGGSQALFFKVNTWGEESFLNDFVYLLEERL